MEQRVPFGNWTPDLPPLKVAGGLLVCRNVVPSGGGGYNPFGSLSALDAIQLPSAPRGAMRGTLADGSNFFVAGTATNLYRKLESGWTSISNPTGYTTLGANRWSIKQFGSIVYAANPRNPMQSIDLASESTMSDVEGAPRAAILEVAQNFLWAGDVYESDLGVLRNAVHWSGLNNGRYWPNPASDDATASLSGRQVLEGNGGFVNAIVAGSEVVSIFQERAIWRADFVGNDIVWQFNRMETNIGCLVQNAAIAIERGVFFLSSDGWRVFDYTKSGNIGKDRINDWFSSDWNSDYPDSITVAKDPNATRVYVSYAGTDSASGVPNRILVWDYLLDRFSVLYAGEHYQLLEVGPITLSLDSPNTVDDPDLLGTGSPDTGAPGNLSFDDRQPGDGVARIGSFTSAFALGEFNGTPLAGVLETGDLELSPGRHSMLKSVRPQVDGEDSTVQAASWIRRGADTEETIDWTLPRPLEKDGAAYFRSDGRYHRLRFNLSPFFTEATEYDLSYRTGGTS